MDRAKLPKDHVANDAHPGVAPAARMKPAQGEQVLRHIIDEHAAPKVASPAEAAQLERVLDAILKIGGTATPADAEVVRVELRKMPLAALIQLQSQGTKVVVCRNGIGDYLPELRKQPTPVGWPGGKTKGDVPGMNFPLTNEVVISVAGGAANAHVPLKGEGHGSANLALHEVTHAIDLGKGGTGAHPALSPAFDAAFRADWDALSNYEKADRHECYAEASARFYSRDPASAQRTPHLHEYFEKHPLGSRHHESVG